MVGFVVDLEGVNVSEKSKTIEEELFEWLRLGPDGWHSKAENAYFNAVALSRLRDDKNMEELADELMIEEIHSVAMEEGVLRESAIALELIIKAIIAQNFQLRFIDPAVTGLPATHDLLALWEKAELPKLSHSDQYRLYFYKTILIWAGRYPTPKSAKDWCKERSELQRFRDLAIGRARNDEYKPIDCGPSEFNRLYQMAENKFCENKNSMPEEFWMD